MINVNIVRNVRIPFDLDIDIRRIAKYEDRTISKTIQRLLQRAVREYLDDNEQGMIHDEELQRFYEIQKEADEIDKALDNED